MDFEIIGEITHIEPIAVGRSIRDLARLRKQYGQGRWRKLKGIAWYVCETVQYALLKSIGTRPTGLGERNSNWSCRFWT